MQQAEHRRDKRERSHGGAQQAANHRPAQRGILLAPSPRPSAIGIMPMIIARAVMRTGRKRVAPASIAARTGLP